MKLTIILTKINYLATLLIASLFFTNINAQEQTTQELVDQINGLTRYYLYEEVHIEIINTSGDGIWKIYFENEEENRTVYFNLKNDFWLEDIELLKTFDGAIIQLHPKNELKTITNNQIFYSNEILEINTKVDAVKTGFFHDRLYKLAEKLGTLSKSTNSADKNLPNWQETVTYINNVLQKANGLRMEYNIPQRIVLTSGNKVPLSFKGTSHGFTQRIINPSVDAVFYLENYYYDIDWTKFIGFEDDVSTLANSEVRFLTLLFEVNALRVTGYTNHDPSGTDFENNYSISGKTNLTRRINFPYSNVSGEKERLTNAIKHFVNLEKEKQVIDPFAD